MQTQLLIGGRLVAGEGASESVLDAARGGEIAAVPGLRAQVDAAWRRPRPRSMAGRLPPPGSVRRCCCGSPSASTPSCAYAHSITQYRQAAGGGIADDCRRSLTYFASLRVCAVRPGTARGVPSRSHQHDPPRSGRRRGLHRAVELPLMMAPGRLRRDRRRQYAGSEALRADPAHGPEAGGAARGAAAAGRGEYRVRWRRAGGPGFTDIRGCAWFPDRLGGDGAEGAGGGPGN